MHSKAALNRLLLRVSKVKLDKHSQSSLHPAGESLGSVYGSGMEMKFSAEACKMPSLLTRVGCWNKHAAHWCPLRQVDAWHSLGVACLSQNAQKSDCMMLHSCLESSSRHNWAV